LATSWKQRNKTEIGNEVRGGPISCEKNFLAVGVLGRKDLQKNAGKGFLGGIRRTCMGRDGNREFLRHPEVEVWRGVEKRKGSKTCGLKRRLKGGVAIFLDWQGSFPGVPPHA